VSLKALLNRPRPLGQVLMSPQDFADIVAWGECVHCHSEKSAHMDDGRCLFAPGSVFELALHDTIAGNAARDMADAEDKACIEMMKAATLDAVKGVKK
jgi:hypothetical protein